MSALEELVRAIVREEIASATSLAAGETYATKPRAAWPPGARSARSARDRIRAVPGHMNPEHGVWTVSRELYARQHAGPVLRVVPQETRRSDEEIADRAIANAGFRMTRSA